MQLAGTKSREFHKQKDQTDEVQVYPVTDPAFFLAFSNIVLFSSQKVFALRAIFTTPKLSCLCRDNMKGKPRGARKKSKNVLQTANVAYYFKAFDRKIP